MPELPEVETVKNMLKKFVLNKKIVKCDVYFDNIISYPNIKEFKKNIKGQKIKDIKRRGKWLLFELDDYYLLSHLRMEGKYFIKENEEISKHEHVIFLLDDGKTLRYQDTRKFGKMYLLDKENIYEKNPLCKLGLEPFDKNLNSVYLKEKLNKKPIKTYLLDQSIIAGIGNIYADEILFLSKINPMESGNNLTEQNLNDIIENTKKVLKKAIDFGGTTIKSYSSNGHAGNFQNELLVHTKGVCPICKGNITKISIGGRSSYFCENCQKKPNF